MHVNKLKDLERWSCTQSKKGQLARSINEIGLASGIFFRQMGWINLFHLRFAQNIGK